MHPETYFPLGKEVHYWDNFERLGGGGYRNNFLNTTFADQNGFKCGEITPAYATVKPEIIREVRNFSSDCKVFYIIRNPIDCLWSSLKHDFRLSGKDLNLATNDDFLNLMNQERTMVHYDYLTNINRWKDSFDDLLVLDYMEITQSPRSLLKTLAGHINISPDFYDLLPKKCLSDVVHTSKGGEIPDELFFAALEYYEEKILALQPIMDKDLSSWLKPKKEHFRWVNELRGRFL